MRFVDTQGRVEKFQQKMKKADTYAQKKKAKRAEQTQRARPLTLKEMLKQPKKPTQSAKSSQPKITEEKQ